MPDSENVTNSPSAVPNGGGVAPSAHLQAVVARLVDAHRTGIACDPVHDALAGGGVAAAYAVQTALVDAVFADDRVVGRKIGLTAPAVQAQLGVDQPDFGVLYASMEVADGAVVPAAAGIAPRVEGEIAFRLGRDLDRADLTLAHVRSAVEAAAPAIEICDSRIANWNITILDTVADNASASGFVTGEWRPLEHFAPREATMTMTVTGHDPLTGRGDACLGDPLEAVRWLARAARGFGRPLRAGQIVLSGALAPMVAFDPGSRVEVFIDGLGSVSVTREALT